MSIRLVSAGRNELGLVYKKTKNQEVVEDFIKSGLDCVLVEGWTQKAAGGAAFAYNKAAKTMRVGVRAISRGNKVYLLKWDGDI